MPQVCKIARSIGRIEKQKHSPASPKKMLYTKRAWRFGEGKKLEGLIRIYRFREWKSREKFPPYFLIISFSLLPPKLDKHPISPLIFSPNPLRHYSIPTFFWGCLDVFFFLLEISWMGSGSH